MNHSTERLDPLQLRHDLKLARQEILELRGKNRQLETELEAVLARESLLCRLAGPCLVALLLSGTFCGTSLAIARGLGAFNIQLPEVRLELPQWGER